MSDVTASRYFRADAAPMTGGLYASRSFTMPADEHLARVIAGQISELIYYKRWEGEFAREYADLAREAWESYLMTPYQIGEIKAYVRDELPPYCLPCDGGTYLRADYPQLYAAIGVYFRLDADNFQTPDMADRYLIGNSGIGIVGQSTGANSVTLTTAQLPAHNHTAVAHSHAYASALPNVTTIGAGAPQATAIPGVSQTGASNITINNRGGGEAHENRPLSMRVLWGIVAR